MIEEIRIRDLGVIADATLALGPGFSVVTGETGAGKTMVLSALGLLMGARSDAGAVRLGAKNASAEAVLRVDRDGPAAQRAVEAGGELETDDDGGAGLILARTVNSDGRSRAYVGGRSAPAGVLAEVGEKLVVVHGQSDQLRLRSAAAQREALDKFGGAELRDALASYRTTYRRWRQVAADLEALRSAERDRLREAESLQAALEEIDTVDPQPDEDETLKVEAMKLGNVEELRTAAAAAHQALVSGEFPETGDATTLVDAAKRQLEAVGAHDAELASLAGRLAEVGYILADISTELAAYAASVDSEGPERLAEVEARRADLNVLIRKYAPSINEVIEWSATGRARLEEISGDSDRIESLQEETVALEAQLGAEAQVLSGLRVAAAEVLSARVSAELAALAMPDAKLIIDVVPGGAPGPLGTDEVSFSLQPHAGSAPRPLGKGASGGELSRVMLAIEVVLAAVDPVPTFVFDEVDAGVGGKAAVEIGRRLAMLAQHVQVVVVTHLPQVAAFASHHIRVTKSRAADGGFTASDVEVLPESERVRELARMLAGQEESASAQAHAEELLLDAARTAAR